jgi:4-hydroxythreonine-4-phosphate dehydrogenase
MKTIGITMGDPLGIGPESVLKALPQFRDQAAFRVFGDAGLLKGLAKDELVPVTADAANQEAREVWAGRASVAYLDAAMAAYQSGEIHALVTAPISKSHVHRAGFPFPGHTEYLAKQTGTQKYVMMMAGPRLRVSLVTIHEPIAKVSADLSVEKIVACIEVTYRSLRERFRISAPRVAVCGLNPHAGENGLLGTEEQTIIGPAVAEAERRGWACSGPRVPDAVFHEAWEGQWDAVVCMYHDQGLIPFKMVHFKDGVNVTLGLPLVRTSPDHGTAFDIAGKGIADPSSMIAAIRLALELS